MNTADTITTECAKLQAARARRVAAMIEAGVEIMAGDADSATVHYQRSYLLGLCRSMADSIDKLTLWTRCDDAPRPVAPVAWVWDDLRTNDDGSLDEIVGSGDFHLEQMSGGHWSLQLGRHLLSLHSQSRLTARIDESGPRAPAPGE